MKNSFINLLGRGTASILLDSRIFGARPATPQCPSGVDAIVTEKQLPSDSGVTAETAKSMSDAADRRHSLNASLLVLIAVYSLCTAATLVS